MQSATDHAFACSGPCGRREIASIVMGWLGQLLGRGLAPGRTASSARFGMRYERREACWHRAVGVVAWRAGRWLGATRANAPESMALICTRLTSSYILTQNARTPQRSPHKSSGSDSSSSFKSVLPCSSCEARAGNCYALSIELRGRANPRPTRHLTRKAMKIFKPLALTLLLLSGAASAGTLPSTNVPGSTPGVTRVLACDSVSFATGTAQNRAACRRMFAREARPSVQTAPLTASDYAS